MEGPVGLRRVRIGCYRLEPNWYAECVHGEIDGKACFRCQRHALGSRRTQERVADRLLFEENVGRICIHQLLGFGWMVEKPGAYRLHRNRVTPELAALDQDRPDGGVGPAVLRRIRRADDSSVVQSNPPGPLDLQKESVDRIVDKKDRGGRA